MKTKRLLYTLALLLAVVLFTLLIAPTTQANDHHRAHTASSVDAPGQRSARGASDQQGALQQLGTLQVNKRPSPATLPEPGSLVTFTVDITNLLVLPSATVTGLEDSVFGDITQSGANGVVATTCQTPQTLSFLAGAYQCTFVAQVSGNAGARHENTVTVFIAAGNAEAIGGQASAVVTLTDVPASLAVEKRANVAQVPEQGAQVVFTVQITNTSPADSVAIQSISDDHVGNVAAGCPARLPITLAPQATLVCTFSGFVGEEASGAHTNLVTVGGVDDDGQPVNASDSLTLPMVDTPAVLTVSKVANPTVLAEPGGEVSFAISVRNESLADGILLTSVTDDRFGDISDFCTPALPAKLDPQAGVECPIVRTLAGQPGTEHRNTVTASGVSTDNVAVTATASASVVFTDVPSALQVTQAPAPSAVLPGGSLVTFTVQMTNTSPVDALTIDQLTDTRYGDVTAPSGQVVASDCVTPQTLAVNEAYRCHFRARVSGPVRATQTNTLTVSATDEDGSVLTGRATATVTVVGPLLHATKQATLLNDQDGDRVAGPGDTLGYTIQVTNLGNGADEVQLLDRVDPKSRLLPTTASTSQGIFAASPMTISVDLGTLAPSTTATVTFAVVIADPLPLGTSKVSNQGWVFGQASPALPTDDPATPAQGDPTETLVVAQPLLQATKRDRVAVDADGDGLPSPGDTLAYDIVIANNGNQGALAAVFSDTLDSLVTLVAGSVQSSQGEISQAGQTTTIAIGQIDAGASVTVTFQVRVTKPLPAGVVQTSNQGQVTGANFDPIRTDDPDTPVLGDATRSLLTAAPLLQISKRDLIFLDVNGDNLVSPGDTLLYGLEIVNIGTVAATDLQVTDTVDPQSTLVAGSVRTTAGDVQRGNGTTDTDVAIQISSLAPQARVDTDFRVIVQQGSQDALTNQAVGRYRNPNGTIGETLTVLSDDPDTVPAPDPTITPLQREGAGGGQLLYLPLVAR